MSCKVGSRFIPSYTTILRSVREVGFELREFPFVKLYTAYVYYREHDDELYQRNFQIKKYHLIRDQLLVPFDFRLSFAVKVLSHC